MKHGIYTASNLKHKHLWVALREEGFPVISTWIDQGQMTTREEYMDLWTRCIKEASSAQVLLFYQVPGDKDRGALVEVGAALAVNTPVLYVGHQANTLSFLKHPLVVVFSTLEVAKQNLRKFTTHITPC